MIAGCALGNENCLGMEIRPLYCYKTLSHVDKSTVGGKNRRVFFFSRMVMNDLMERDKKVSALAILDECDIKGDLKHIVGGWKYQREREWAGTTDSKHKIGKMSSTHGPRAGSPRQPSKGNEMCWVFWFFFFFFIPG